MKKKRVPFWCKDGWMGGWTDGLLKLDRYIERQEKGEREREIERERETEIERERETEREIEIEIEI